MEKFAFLIHPIELDDIYRKYRLLKYLPKTMVEAIAGRLSPSVVSNIENVRGYKSAAEGWFVGVPLTSKMMMRNSEKKVIDKIIDAGRIAETLGAKIIGLGAYTSVVGDAGITIAKNLNIAVTTGNTYTVAAAMEAVEEACRLLNKRISECEAAVVGANGSIGRVCSELILREVSTLNLIGRENEKLQELKKHLLTIHPNKNIRITTSIEEGIINSDVVITVTSSIKDVIMPEYIKVGAIVCDVARPRDVAKSVQEKRKDVLVIEGGVIEVPKGLKFNFNYGFPKGLTYACMAETMILALEKRYENFSLGRDMDVSKVDEIRGLAAKHGFKVAGLRSFERVIDQSHIKQIMEEIDRLQKRATN